MSSPVEPNVTVGLQNEIQDFAAAEMWTFEMYSLEDTAMITATMMMIPIMVPLYRVPLFL